MTDPDNNPRESSTRSARDACMAAYQTASAVRIANCGACDDDGLLLDSSGVATRQRCTHPRRDTR